MNVVHIDDLSTLGTRLCEKYLTLEHGRSIAKTFFETRTHGSSDHEITATGHWYTLYCNSLICIVILTQRGYGLTMKRKGKLRVVGQLNAH